MSKLEAAQKDAKISAGALLFFEAHPELWRAHANVNVLASAIQSRELGPLDSLEAWEKAYTLVGHQLAAEPRQQEEAPREEIWPHRFMRPVRSMADIKAYPAQEYKALWHDRSRVNGELSEKAKIFRSIVQAVIDNENARREGENQ
jgi:hypothetical protein